MFGGPNGSEETIPKSYLAPRYRRSLDLLLDAIRFTNRAYVFDNSREARDASGTWIAEITEGRELELKSNQIPAWFKRAVLDKLKPATT